jgi:nicotinate dehydrogenase small FeS subunit
MDIKLLINGSDLFLTIEPGELLLVTLRRLGLVGTKKGCGEGTCGACTVLVDGRPTLACITFTAQMIEREITTIEGLGTLAQPHPLQKSFVAAGAVQCGYCTPGMILAAKALLDRVPSPSDDDIRRALDGNLCRCTGYNKIIAAVKRASKELAPAARR